MNYIKEIRTAASLLLFFLFSLGVIYPVFMTGVGKWLFPHQSGGSLIYVHHNIVGSKLIGQNFSEVGYFHGRPSFAGKGYDALASSGSNMGPTSKALIERIKVRAKAEEVQNHSILSVPITLVSASASGLDPDISPIAAHYQAKRVASNRHLPLSEVNNLIKRHIKHSSPLSVSEPVVNVLELNLGLDNLAKKHHNRG